MGCGQDRPWAAAPRDGRGLVLGPTAPYERSGDVNKVVFPTGWVLDEPTGTLSIYYGAGDAVVAMATAQLDDLLEHMRTAARSQQRRPTDRHGF